MWWLAVHGSHSTGRHFHWAVSVPLQKSFGVSLRCFSSEVVDFEDCLDVSFWILLMLLPLFVCHAAAREARREPGAAEQAAERRPLLSTLEPPRAVRLLPQQTPPSQVTSRSLCGCRLLLFTISSSTFSLTVSHSPSSLFLPSLEHGPLPSPTLRLCPDNMADFFTWQALLAAASHRSAFLPHTLSIWTPQLFFQYRAVSAEIDLLIS